jgi:hypothetical protein
MLNFLRKNAKIKKNARPVGEDRTLPAAAAQPIGLHL